MVARQTINYGERRRLHVSFLETLLEPQIPSIHQFHVNCPLKHGFPVAEGVRTHAMQYIVVVLPVFRKSVFVRPFCEV